MTRHRLDKLEARIKPKTSPGKQKELEKIQADALLKLTAARAALGGMKGDYLKLEEELTAQAGAALAERELTADKVRAGQTSLADYMRAGLSEAELKAKAQAAADEKLAWARRLILEKQLEIFRLEVVEAEARQNVIYCATYHGQTQIKKMKAD
jgi:hypothetical protein